MTPPANQLKRKGDIVQVPTNDIYKSVSIFLAGVVLTGCVSWFIGPKNAVTQQDLKELMPGLMAQYNPYAATQKSLEEKLQLVSIEQVRQGTQMQQMQIDLSRVSEKLGVAAHPGVVGIR